MMENQHIRPAYGNRRVEVDLKDGTTVVFSAVYENYGHGEQGVEIVWGEKVAQPN